ncbi:GroES-like protein [Gymnopus androsaceus JB14]|uniref:GroES-like protein n=1 Tax=Gymnopus androsaceus JB14 TaxID=1447944 RepID=A0A6A4I1N5_9AGAR|nr:GroES-like protein [Gymnopus androsaceus JB14]
MTATIPTNIRAVQVQPDKTVKVISIPFGEDELVKNLPEDQVIIRVRAVGLNPTDWKHALGDWGTPGSILGCDCAGDVLQVGSAVKHLEVGDRVAGFNYGGNLQTNNGAYAEYVRLLAALTFKMPNDMTYEEGASFPIPHFTAVQALYMRLNLSKPFNEPTPKSGEKEIILIWGGSTAVGHHTIQLALLSNLRVFATASPAAHNDLKALGVERCFDYKADDIVKQIHLASGDQAIIYGIDTVSENGTTELCIDAMSLTRNSHLITLLPISKECQERRQDKVKVEFTLGYSLQGYEFTFANAIKFPAIPEDKARILEYVAEYMPRVLENWKAGKGNDVIKPQRLRKLEGGLEGIEQGLKIMRDGNYGREKLVYTID